MPDSILIVNAGSSSLKFCLFRAAQPPEKIVRGQLEALTSNPRFVARDPNDNVIDEVAWPTGSTLDHQAAIEFLLNWGQTGGFGDSRLVAAGHRVVHGGTHFAAPARVTNELLTSLESLIPLAPLHQPHNLAAIRAVERHAPTLPQVACFDTSFHRTQPIVAQQFALPRRLMDAGIQRYGFHGLSYEYIATHLPHIDPAAANGRTIVAHLGNGASLCALHRGISIATTMSFTPLDGLMMGTRCGAIDPGVLIYLMDQYQLDARALENLLTYQSGLLGVSGISSDMRALLHREATECHAAEAIELFIYRITREIGSLTAALGGLDSIIFTGGIGEHAAPIRARICRALAWLGLELDEVQNDLDGPRINRPSNRVSAWVIPTDEELMIAQHTLRFLNSPST